MWYALDFAGGIVAGFILFPFAYIAFMNVVAEDLTEDYERKAKDQEMARMIGNKFPPFIN